MARPGHLVSRFFGSVLPLGPAPADAAWALEHLRPGERAVWARMSPADRRHAAGVARRAAAALGSRATPEVVVAALLHDAGKVESGLGTFGRVVATLAVAVAGRERAGPWSRRGGVRRRLGLYLRHDELGASLLARAGSQPLVVAWAAEHHQPASGWTVPDVVGRALKAADDD